ncbi:MAG: hypothetical protein K2N26_08705 [Oscillospiraceae bacterium]|nr:hypothetical protein [Oscillospiraceae bacterium]
MKLFKKKCRFEKSLTILSEKGFTAEYAQSLRDELAEAERKQDIAKGKSFLANALLILGNISEAYQTFEDINMKYLEPHLIGNLVSNMVFADFVRNKFKRAEELYQAYNAAILGEHSDASKRSLAIHEHIKGRYENSVEILVNMMGSECRFLDICMVKSMLRLDMFEQAADFSAYFSRYSSCGELGEEVKILKNKIISGLSPQKKAEYIKNSTKG